MAFVHSGPLGWHEGEEKMHSLLHVPNQDNPTAPGLTPYGAHMLQSAPLIAIGTLDREGRPWTTLVGGEPGFARPVGNSLVGVKTLVDRRYDPVIQLLLEGEKESQASEGTSRGRIFSALAIDLASRSRVKIAGRTVACSLGSVDSKFQGHGEGIGEAQLIFKVEQSLGMKIAHGVTFAQSSDPGNRQLPKISK